jgi:uncharacterized repeat protein (TIGR01451 family)
VDQKQFDRLTVAVANGAQRRTLLRVVSGVLISAGLRAAPEVEGKGKGKHKAKGKGKTSPAKRRQRDKRKKRDKRDTATVEACPLCKRRNAQGRCVPDRRVDGKCCANGTCLNGFCFPGPCSGPICTDQTCPTGCCDAQGSCHIDDDSACGTGGGSCTSCTALGTTCGGGGIPGQCGGCTAPQCPAGANCGTILNPCDGTPVSCGGPCPPGQVCGAGVSPNVCGGTCTPRTCAAGNCGPLADGCGGLVQCGSCSPGQVCGGGGTPSVCGVGTCTPRSCAAQAIQCGPAGDGCGGTLNCGTCTAPQTCGGGGIPNVCGGGRASITLTKSSDAAGAISEGEVITYTFRAANTGPRALAAVVVSDPLPGLSVLTCGGSSLAPGAALVCTATYTVTAVDVAAGHITNTATVSGTGPDAVVVTATASLVIP